MNEAIKSQQQPAHFLSISVSICIYLCVHYEGSGGHGKFLAKHNYV